MPSFRAHDPDRAVWLDPVLDALDALKIRQLACSHENEVNGLARPPLDHVGVSTSEQSEELIIVEVGDGHLRAGLAPKLVQQRSGRDGVGAQLCPSLASPPRTALKTMTPTSQPAYAPATASTIAGTTLSTRLGRSRPKPANPPKTTAPLTPPARAPAPTAAVTRGFRPRSTGSARPLRRTCRFRRG